MKLVYFERFAHPITGQRLAELDEVEVMRLSFEDPAAVIDAALAAAQIYHCRSSHSDLPAPYFVTSELLERCPRLLAVSTYGAGYDTVDAEVCAGAGIIVVNQAGGNKQAVVEHALGMLLTLSKRLVETNHRMRREHGLDREQFMGHNAQGKTLGIVGLGNIGSHLAAVASAALQMRVIACDPYLSDEQFIARGATRVDFDDLLEQSDYVSVHCPRNAETEGMFRASAFDAMRPGAYFITTARGGIHDEQALAEALRAGRIAGAGVDVWRDEPPSPDHPLMGFDNVIVSPHTAGVTHESREQLGIIAADQIAIIARGGRAPRIVNPRAWPGYCERFERQLGRRPG